MKNFGMASRIWTTILFATLSFTAQCQIDTICFTRAQAEKIAQVRLQLEECVTHAAHQDTIILNQDSLIEIKDARAILLEQDVWILEGEAERRSKRLERAEKRLKRTRWIGLAAVGVVTLGGVLVYLLKP